MSISQYNMLQTIRLNIKKNIKNNLRKKNMIICYKNSKIFLDKTSQINCNGKLRFGVKENPKSKQETRISMGKNSEFNIEGDFSIGFGSDVRIFDNAKFSIKNKPRAGCYLRGSYFTFRFIRFTSSSRSSGATISYSGMENAVNPELCFCKKLYL